MILKFLIDIFLNNFFATIVKSNKYKLLMLINVDVVQLNQLELQIECVNRNWLIESDRAY